MNVNADAVEINLNTKTIVNIIMSIQGKHSIYHMLTVITQSNALLEFKVLTNMSVVTPPHKNKKKNKKQNYITRHSVKN